MNGKITEKQTLWATGWTVLSQNHARMHKRKNENSPLRLINLVCLLDRLFVTGLASTVDDVRLYLAFQNCGKILEAHVAKPGK